MAFNSLNPPTTMAFAQKLSGNALAEFSSNSVQAMPFHLQDPKLQFKALWLEWICCSICIAFSFIFAGLCYQEIDTVWLVLSVVFLVLALIYFVVILERSQIISINIRALFTRSEFEDHFLTVHRSDLDCFKAPEVLRFVFQPMCLELVQFDSNYGEVTYAVPWSKVKEVKPCLYFGAPSLGISFYPCDLQVRPLEAFGKLNKQLTQTRIPTMYGGGYGCVVIPTAAFGMHPQQLADIATQYIDFNAEYFA